MTVVVGVEHPGGVVMGADSIGIDEDFRATVRSDEKLFRSGDFLIGFAGSFRAGQLLRYSFVPPVRPLHSFDVMRYMCVDFVDGMRECLSAGGVASMRDGVEEGGNFLVALGAQLFNIDPDYQVGRAACGYAAIGIGEPYAEGALYATRKSKQHKARVLTALEAASEHCAVVRGPFVVLGTKIKPT